MNDVEEGDIEEAFIIAHTSDGNLMTYMMGQTEAEILFDMERAKIATVTGHTSHSNYTDEDTPG